MECEFSVDVPGQYFEDKKLRTCKTLIPIPLPEYAQVGDYVGVVCSTELGRLLSAEEVYSKLKEFVYHETMKLEDMRDDEVLRNVLASGQETNLNLSPVISKADIHRKENLFMDKFSFVVANCSSQNLITLMQMEVHMKRKMTELIRARNWEVDQLSKQCEKVLSDDQLDDMHPHKLSHLNEKLRQVYTTYSHQVSQLCENQRKQYRQAVDSLYSRGSLPAELLEEIELDENDGLQPYNQTLEPTLEGGISESYTIYIGAQLKSMHNACLVTFNSLTDVCQTFQDDWTTSSRLEMATRLYGRSLSALVLLVPRDPMYHINSSSNFFRICEQSTELHFNSLGDQLKEVVDATKSCNMWRADCLERGTNVSVEQRDELDSAPKSSQNLRHETSLSVGDIYVTKHSNLHKVQMVFHLVTDDSINNSDISSRHPCLNGIRNSIRMMARFGVTNIHIPLLLIDRPDESTTISWCVKRAEMVFKCVKGFLMEACGGSSLDNVAHFNVNFVLPSGLAPKIYSSILNMFPTIFHLVPSVKLTVD